jgi:hypothetical protein
VRWVPADDLPALQHEAVSDLLALAATALGAPGAVDAGAAREAGAPGEAGYGDGHRGPGAGTALRRAAEQAASQRAATVS